MHVAQVADPRTADTARIAFIFITTAIVVFRRQLLHALIRVLIIAFIIAAIAGAVSLVQLMHG